MVQAGVHSGRQRAVGGAEEVSVSASDTQNLYLTML